VFFSASSDAFAPQAAPHTHALLAHWLPLGTVVGIVTKGIIPERTLALLAEFRPQVEGVSVGVTSLDAHRNRVVEPGVAPSAERLALIERIATLRLPVTLRMDPLFPGLDDGAAALETVL
jgi:DNA repair photolyase